MVSHHIRALPEGCNNARVTKIKQARVRRTYEELFLDKLATLAPDAQKLVGNKKLCKALGWEEVLYDRIKWQLSDQGKVVHGRGNGGSVGLASPPGTKGLDVFVSYAHSDEGLKVELLKHLNPLSRLGMIEAWHDRKIKPGDDWDKVISSNLEKADIILLLVSIDFINSSYCYDIELERALERQEKQEARVVPIILRPCMWQYTPFAKLQALPKESRAVSLWPDKDDALLNITEGLRVVAQELLSSR